MKLVGESLMGCSLLRMGEVGEVSTILRLLANGGLWVEEGFDGRRYTDKEGLRRHAMQKFITFFCNVLEVVNYTLF